MSTPGSRKRSPIRPALLLGLVALATTLLAGCAGNTPAYVQLQNSIKQTVGSEYGEPPVQSVDCTPQLSDVSYQQGIAQLSCVIHFQNGSTYATPATIEARSMQFAGYHFTFNSPPAKNSPTALPRPLTPGSPTAADSLFASHNLSRAVGAIRSRFASNQVIVSLAIYPGELEAVIGGNGQVQTVTDTAATGALQVGPVTSFSGTLNGISLKQLNPTVPQRLAGLIAAHGGVPTRDLERFVLTFFAHGLAGWTIATTGTTHFQAYLQGDGLKEISATGSRSLG